METGAESYVYVGVADRAAFDRIRAPCHDRGENRDGHVLTKSVEETSDGGRTTVVFQYWIKSLTDDALLAERAQATGNSQ
jgi:hypothetical protein